MADRTGSGPIGRGDDERDLDGLHDDDVRDDLDGDLDRTYDDDVDPADAVPAGSLAGSPRASRSAGGARAGAGGGSTALRPERSPGRIRSIGVFYRQVVAELRKVIWPTRKELLTYTSVVLVFVVVLTLIVSVFDFAFGQAVLQVFGDSSL